MFRSFRTHTSSERVPTQPQHRGVVGVCLTFLLVVLSWIDLPILTRLENVALDVQFRVRGERDAGSNVLLVLIDEKSLLEVGRWPWPRETQARLLDRLSSAGPKVIGLDVIYSETEQDPASARLREFLNEDRVKALVPGKTAQEFEQYLRAESPDQRLGASLKSAGNVVLAVPFFVPERFGADRPQSFAVQRGIELAGREFMLVRQADALEELQPYEATAALLPVGAVSAQAQTLGHVYRLPDHDGVTRREVLAVKHRDAYYPSFSLEIARLYLGLPRDQMVLSLGEGIQLGATLIPTDQRLRTVINYAGRDRHFPWVSATDVLHGRVSPDVIRGNAVLVGTAALGTYDQLSTPFSANFPGVEKNATVVENVLQRQFFGGGFWKQPLELALILLLGLTCSLILPRVRAMQGAMAAGLVGASYLGLAQWFFVEQRVSLPLVMPLMTVGAVFLGTTVLSYAVRERQAREIRALFSSYVSPKIVQALMSAPSKARLGGERKELTMLFADVVGFTPYSEKRSAEEVVAQLNEYLGAMTEVIFKWNGTLDKFVGDEIVVFWGAPVDQPDHVELGVRCALEMRRRLKDLQDRWRREGKPVLENGIGINTGTVVVGNIGAEGKKMDYTAIGDQVNVAARFQGLTRTLGYPLLLTEQTAIRLQNEGASGSGVTGFVHGGPLQVQKVQVVKVKGRDEAVGAYTVAESGVAIGEDPVSRAQAS